MLFFDEAQRIVTEAITASKETFELADTAKNARTGLVTTSLLGIVFLLSKWPLGSFLMFFGLVGAFSFFGFKLATALDIEDPLED